MTDGYRYDPNTWNPILAGVVAGATAAIVAGLITLILDTPSDISGASLAVVLIALAIGALSGLLWRRLRASANAMRTFSWTIAGGFFITLAAIAITDQAGVNDLIRYAVPLAAVIFITVGFITPLLDGVTAPQWVAIIPIVIALAIGVAFLGRDSATTTDATADLSTAARTSTVITDSAGPPTG
jgi:hypothetical protein